MNSGSINSPYSATPVGHSKFNFDMSPTTQQHQQSSSFHHNQQNYGKQGNYQPYGGQRNFRNNNGNNSSFNQGNSPGFNINNYANNNNNQHQNGISLFIKANNITEELLRSLFNANVANAKILSIEVKTK